MSGSSHMILLPRQKRSSYLLLGSILLLYGNTEKLLQLTTPPLALPCHKVKTNLTINEASAYNKHAVPIIPSKEQMVVKLIRRQVLRVASIGMLALGASILPVSNSIDTVRANERCNIFGGLVHNQSSFWMQIKYDRNGSQVYSWLAPGQRSDAYTCDTDFITVPAGPFKVRIGQQNPITYQGGQWAKIGASGYMTCYNLNDGVHVVGCYS